MEVAEIKSFICFQYSKPVTDIWSYFSDHYFLFNNYGYYLCQLSY